MLFNGQFPIDDDRPVARQRGIIGDMKIAVFDGIPRIGIEIHLLRDAALQQEQQIILHQPGFVPAVHGRCQFHEDTDAVTLADFHLRSLVT